MRQDYAPPKLAGSLKRGPTKTVPVDDGFPCSFGGNYTIQSSGLLDFWQLLSLFGSPIVIWPLVCREKPQFRQPSMLHSKFDSGYPQSVNPISGLGFRV